MKTIYRHVRPAALSFGKRLAALVGGLTARAGGVAATINLLSIIIALIVGTGCRVTPPANTQSLYKNTTWGAVVSWPDGATTPSLKVGIIREMWLVNPTSIVPVYCAPLATESDADLNLLHNKASEKINTKP